MKALSPDRGALIARRRKKAIRRAGYPTRWPDEIAAEQKWKCYYCQRTMKKIPPCGNRKRTLDHKLPISRGGKTQRSNLVAACVRCNQRKANLTAEEFISKLLATQARKEAMDG